MPTTEINWSNEVYKDVKTFANKYGLSMKGVFSNAIKYYRLLKEETRKGNRIFIENPKTRHKAQILVE